MRVREGQRPLVRAKVPVQVVGLPFYSGITVGDEKELALHVGTNMDAGPTCRVSYRPNDYLSPLAVLLKMGFGVWGSPHGAPFTIAAEFNLVRRESVSFMLRLKPRVGSFSLRKHFLSTSGTLAREGSVSCSSGHAERNKDMGFQEEVEVAVAERPGEAMMNQSAGGQTQGDGLVYETYNDCGIIPLGLGQVSGSIVSEKKCYLSDDPGSPDCTGGLRHPGERSSDLEIPGAQEVGSVGMDLLTQRSLENGDACDSPDSGVEIDRDASLGDHNHQPETKRNGLLQSWSGNAHSSWGLTVHSAIPLGRRAVGQVQWGMRGPSRAGDEGGRCFYGYKLPVLVLDKISIRSIDFHRNLQNVGSAFSSDSGPLSNEVRYLESPVDDGSQLGFIASMCYSMRNQLNSLHSDHSFLKKVIEDMKAEADQSSRGEKRASTPKPRTKSTQEEDSIRSQLFEELHKKTSSRTSSKDGLINSGFCDDNRGVPSAQNQESIFDMPVEGLLSDKRSGDLQTKARGSPERSVKQGGKS